MDGTPSEPSLLGEPCMTLTEYQTDVLGELINIGTGNAANVLNQMVQSHITLQVPGILLVSPSELKDQYKSSGDKCVAIRIEFGGAFEGITALIFSPSSASSLVSLLVGQADLGMDMDSLRIGTLQEVGNIVLNGVMGSFSNMLGEHLNYMPPDYHEGEVASLLPTEAEQQGAILFIRANFIIEEHLIEGDVLIFFNASTLREITRQIDTKLAMA